MSYRNYYDTSSYGRNRGDSSRISSSSGASDRPTSVAAKYITPSFKTSSIPVLSRDRSNTRENEKPIAAIANRYANYKIKDDDKPKYNERKDVSYNRLIVPGCTNSKSRDPSPVSTSAKYNLNRTSRPRSPDRRNLKTPTLPKSRSRDPSPKEKEKDIPSKPDKSSGYGSGYSSYKIYPRSSSSYTRPMTRTETKPEITLSRYGISNRLSSSYLRGSSADKSPTSSVSPSIHVETDLKTSYENSTTDTSTTPEVKNEDPPQETFVDNETEEIFNTITVITRHTSPTPPGSSAYVRTRRADMAKTIEKTITRSNKKPPMVDKVVQSDRLDDTTRNNRFGGNTRASLSSWSSYSPSNNKYTGYAGRYSTQYANIRDQSVSSPSTSERSEPNHFDNNECKENSILNSIISTQTEPKQFKPISIENSTSGNENNTEVLSVYKENEEDKTSEIIINVNLKLKKVKTPNAMNSSEVVSPEVIITNSQLPPQAPKTEATVKVKKIKIKKSSSDSAGESKKKVIKKRRGSTSSAESDNTSDKTSSERTSPAKGIIKRSSPSVSRQISTSSSDIANEISENGQNKVKHSMNFQTSRESNSPDSSVTTSTQTSCSDDEARSKSKSTRSNDLSRTSADESIPLDKCAKYSPPLNQKVEPTTDEAKSFLIRALAPVTNFFKQRHQDNTDNSHWLDSRTESTSNDVPNLSTESEHTNNERIGPDQEKITLRTIKHIESGERAWWLESDKSEKKIKNSPNTSSEKNFQPRKIRHIESGERDRWLESNSDNKGTNNSCDNNRLPEPTKKTLSLKYSNHDSEEKPWWLDSNANIPAGVERISPLRKTSSESEKSEKFDFFKLRHIDSGEKEWWHVSESDNNTHSNSKDKLNHTTHSSKSTSDLKSNFPLKKIRHVESGERPWWLSSSKNIPEGIEKLPTPSPPPESDSSMSDEVQEYMPNRIPSLPGDEPLGDRRSPEGLETPREPENYRHRQSPYENVDYRNIMPQTDYGKTSEKFVSRYTDIDDIFGTSGQMYSPFMDSILARRTGQTPYENELSDCEEIDPTQVRIHDSTPQHPVIKKLRCRSEIIDCRDEDQLDDVALQVYKNNDYGVYLDLESTIGEQQEEIEGIREKRRNAIVLRTQLSVRVHSIIEKLRQAEGRELRKALFSLKQVLQRDKDLVHEFVENEGLNCLMSVGTADPNYLEYVLRALGQIVLYVDGMHGVMHHKTCIQWLYTLTTSPFRHIVKNCLKLLMVFVEYNDMNCTLLINAIHAVDTAEGRRPWANIMKILKDFDASDTELLIYATTLVNRCLNNAVNKDVYYDQINALEDQGFDDIIKLYMSKQGTDLDLLRQFQIYEAVLSYEDGDGTGTALKQLDDSVINIIRRRSSICINQGQRRRSKRQVLKDEEGSQRYTTGLKQRIQNGTLGHSMNAKDALLVIRKKTLETNLECNEVQEKSPIKSPDEGQTRVAEMTGLLMKAKEGLAKSQSKDIMKSPPMTPKGQVTESDVQWEELRKTLNRPYNICDLDFSDLIRDEDNDVSPTSSMGNGVPPPPLPPPPLLMFNMNSGAPPPPPVGNQPPSLKANLSNASSSTSYDDGSIKKNKKTVKLFWKEVTEGPMPPTLKQKVGSIWDDLPDVNVDTKMLEHLFESRSNDLLIKEKLNDPKKTFILDTKRSNAINIGMKKLPTPQAIKAAILKMDATVIGREGIEKVLTMLPTEEEKIKIEEAQYAHPDIPLGNAEQFLLALASITELYSRLKLWLFKLDFEIAEKEIAEPLMDLKQGIAILKGNATFKAILSTLRSVGSFLNGTQVKGFRLEYLSKVMEVKDTVHKHPLLYHICEMIIQKFPESSDFFSEVGPVIRASKVDFDVLKQNLQKLEVDCKNSWDHLKNVAKHDGPMITKTRINEFITDAAERIILLGIIEKKVLNRFSQFLLYIGVPLREVSETKPSAFLKILSEFALEYMTSRERVLQQLAKKANHRERNKTRGKLIIDSGNYSNKNGDIAADAALRELLMTDGEDSSVMGRKKIAVKCNKSAANKELQTPDEIFESLVKSSMISRRKPRERKRARLVEKLSLERAMELN